MSSETNEGEALLTGNAAAALLRISQYEATLRRGLFNRLMRALGRTSAFAAIYRRIGPRLDTWLHRRFGGRVAARLYGVPTLLLVTRGAKTGLPRTSPLVYLRDGDAFIVVGTNFGHGTHPAWTGNLLAQPLAEIEVASERLAVSAAFVDEAAFAGYWPRFVGVYPGYANYLERRGLPPRMFRMHMRS